MGTGTEPGTTAQPSPWWTKALGGGTLPSMGRRTSLPEPLFRVPPVKPPTTMPPPQAAAWESSIPTGLPPPRDRTVGWGGGPGCCSPIPNPQPWEKRDPLSGFARSEPSILPLQVGPAGGQLRVPLVSGRGEGSCPPAPRPSVSVYSLPFSPLAAWQELFKGRRKRAQQLKQQ